jgi:hypothetical protein
MEIVMLLVVETAQHVTNWPDVAMYAIMTIPACIFVYMILR